MALEAGSTGVLVVVGLVAAAAGLVAGRIAAARALAGPFPPARHRQLSLPPGRPGAVADMATALEALGAATLVWPPDDPAQPGPASAAVAEAALVAPAALVERAGGDGALRHGLAEALSGCAAALDGLRQRGAGFAWQTAGWQLAGLPVGGQAVVVARPAVPGEGLCDLGATACAVWQTDAEGRLVWASEAYARAVEVAGPSDAVARDLMLDAPARQDGVRAAAGTASVRTRTVTVAGQRRVWRILLQPRGPAGARAGASGIAFDVTDEVEGLEAARREVAAHVETLNILTDAVALFDARRRLRTANSAFCELWGLDRTTLDERPTLSELFDILRARDLLPHEKDITGWKERQLAAFSETGAMADEMWPLPGGRILRVAKKRLPDGGLLILFDDITGTAALQARFKTQLEVQAATLDKLGEAVAVFASDGSVSFANAAFARIWAVEPEFLAGRPGFEALVERLRLLFREDGYWSGIKARLTDPSPEARRETQGEIARLDQTVLTWLTRPLPDGATLVAFADVTAARKVEQAALERAAAFQEADQLKTDFVRNVSYQLRTPLTTIAGYADMLASGVGGELAPVQQSFLGSIQSASAQLADMIESILDLAMIDAGQLTLDLGDVDVRALLDEAADMARSRASDSQVRIAVAAAPDVGLIRADGKRIRQVLFSLTGIAMRAVGPGDTITLGARRLEDSVRLWVEDTGPRLSEQERAGAFKTFDDRTRRGGIPLALVTRFIDMHGGWTSVAAGAAGGTVVSCRLPAIAAPDHAAPELDLAS